MSNFRLSQCESVFISCILLKDSFAMHEFVIGSHKIVFLVDLPVIPEAVLGNNAETVNYPPAMGNVNGQQNSSIMPAPDSGEL